MRKEDRIKKQPLSLALSTTTHGTRKQTVCRQTALKTILAVITSDMRQYCFNRLR